MGGSQSRFPRGPQIISGVPVLNEWGPSVTMDIHISDPGFAASDDGSPPLLWVLHACCTVVLLC